MAQSSRKPVEVPPPRRALWDRFVGRAFGRVSYDKVPGGMVRMSRLIKNARTAALCSAGRVTLVGAGPGDPELLTLKAVRALQSADVILFDDLVSDEVLELARRKAKRMLVGKRGGRQSCRQDDINDLMIKLAKQGKHVVRLKSGDPMIFGRAGEEIERLELEGIAVSVVPGISSGLAMAAELGVSLTHRERAHSVRFVTGHSRAGNLPGDLDWKGLADPETTLIFYMGGRTAPLIAERLVREGLCEGMPVVIATGVSRAGGQRVCTTLGDLRVAEAVASGGPVLLGIGDVFRRCKGHVVQSGDLRFAS
jgi:uroporphyrin-III C-methyltransferase / precorrin-2 dehydrogenase / sirohydrochlorin ferrochelatase